MADANDKHPLPASVQAVADIIGETATLELLPKLPRCWRKGHPRGAPYMYVPKRPTAKHRITQIVGEEAARKLAREFGGELIQLALCAEREKAPLRQKRDGKVIKMLQHMTQRDVAKRVGVSTRTVRRIARAASATQVAA